MLAMGFRYDMGAVVPIEADGWQVAMWGKEFCVNGQGACCVLNWAQGLYGWGWRGNASD